MQPVHLRVQPGISLAQLGRAWSFASRPALAPRVLRPPRQSTSLLHPRRCQVDRGRFGVERESVLQRLVCDFRPAGPSRPCHPRELLAA
eukprot:8212058-Pyramimonas_sp.AAC.1